MARNLAEAGHDVVAWNRTPAAAEGLGATVADTPAGAVEGAGVVVTMLADGEAVNSVIQEALPALRSPVVWAQMSTVGTEWTERLAALAADHGIVFVDAPVMGSRPQAEEGMLVVLASGAPEGRERAAEAFDAVAREVMWLGDRPGLGTRLKLVVNHWLLVSVENLAETVALAEGLGVDPRRFLEVIDGSPFDMAYAHWKAAMMLEREFPTAFALRHARKDLGLALAAAGEVGIDLALAGATHGRFGQAIDRGYGDEDSAATYRVAGRS